MAKTVARAVPAVVVPWAMTAAPGAERDWVSSNHILVVAGDDVVVRCCRSVPAGMTESSAVA